MYVMTLQFSFNLMAEYRDNVFGVSSVHRPGIESRLYIYWGSSTQALVASMARVVLEYVHAVNIPGVDTEIIVGPYPTGQSLQSCCNQFCTQGTLGIAPES